MGSQTDPTPDWALASVCLDRMVSSLTAQDVGLVTSLSQGLWQELG